MDNAKRGGFVKYGVTFKITGEAYAEVEANSEEEAEREAMHEAEIQNWTFAGLKSIKELDDEEDS